MRCVMNKVIVCFCICECLLLFLLVGCKKENNSVLYTAPSDYITETTVYITDTGHKYHKEYCFCLKKSKHSISIDEAISNGFTACKHCYN